MEILKPSEKDEYLEWYIEEQFVEEIEDAGWITLKGDKIKRGFSDRFLFGPGATTIIVEFKRTGARKKRRGEKLQNHYRALFVGLGFTAIKVVGWNASAEILESLLKEHR